MGSEPQTVWFMCPVNTKILGIKKPTLNSYFSHQQFDVADAELALWGVNLRPSGSCVR